MPRELKSFRHLHRSSKAADIQGYEPILEIRIPGSPSVQDAGAELMIDFDKDTTNQAVIDPLGDGQRPANIRRQLVDDQRLQRVLQQSAPTKGISAPAIDQANRSVINPSSTLLSNHPLVQPLSEEYQQAGALLLEYILKYHEIGTRETPGGHFTSLIDPETVVIGEQLPWSDIQNVLQGNSARARAIPWRYHEVRAILQEREVIDALVDEERQVVEELRDDARYETRELEEELKSVDLDRLGELLANWDSYFDEHRDERIIEIVDFLEETVGRQTALDLLKVPQEAVMHPSKWLCHVIHDIREGRTPEEIPHHGSYWETTAHPDDDTLETVRQRTRRRREAMVTEDFSRAFQSTYEVLSITEDELVRRWYSYRPGDDFQLRHVRYTLVVQELFNQLHNSGIRIFNTGAQPAAIVRPDQEDRFNTAGYQRLGVDPFKQAMEAEIESDDIGNYFEYETDRKTAYKAWKYGREKVMASYGFSQPNGLLEWIGQ